MHSHALVNSESISVISVNVNEEMWLSDYEDKSQVLNQLHLTSVLFLSSFL